MLLCRSPNFVSGSLHVMVPRPDFRAFYSPGHLPRLEQGLRLLLVPPKYLHSKKIQFSTPSVNDRVSNLNAQDVYDQKLTSIVAPDTCGGESLFADFWRACVVCLIFYVNPCMGCEDNILTLIHELFTAAFLQKNQSFLNFGAAKSISPTKGAGQLTPWVQTS